MKYLIYNTYEEADEAQGAIATAMGLPIGDTTRYAIPFANQDNTKFAIDVKLPGDLQVGEPNAYVHLTGAQLAALTDLDNTFVTE